MKCQASILVLLLSLFLLPVDGFWLGKFRNWLLGAGSSGVNVEHSTEHYELPPDSFLPDATVDESGVITTEPDFEVFDESGSVKQGRNYVSNVIVNPSSSPQVHTHNHFGYPVGSKDSSTRERVNNPRGVPGPTKLDMTEGESNRFQVNVDNDLKSVGRVVNTEDSKSKSNIGVHVHEVSVYNIAVLDENGEILYTEQVTF